VGFLGALVQPLFVAAHKPRGFVFYWLAIACVNVVCAGSGIVFRYFFYSDRSDRRKTITVVGQAVPALAAGLLITIGILVSGSEGVIAFLPAIWVLCYGMGVVASRPFLPRMIGMVAVYYFLAGILLLRLAAAGSSMIFSGWSVGLSFGIGQLLSGLILYWNLERNKDEQKT
jgi:hypothetical protein